MTITSPKPGKLLVETAIGDTLSDEEMDRALSSRRREVDAKLKPAHEDRALGADAPLEPIHVLLAQERERFKASQG